LKEHSGNSENILEVVCDMSPLFLAGLKEEFPGAETTVDWFHVVQLFTNAVDTVRRNETKKRKLPKGTRWAVLKNAESSLTAEQVKALEELNRTGAFTCTAWKVKEKLRWVIKAASLRSAKWRLTHFIRHIYDTVGYVPAALHAAGMPR